MTQCYAGWKELGNAEATRNQPSQTWSKTPYIQHDDRGRVIEDVEEYGKRSHYAQPHRFKPRLTEIEWAASQPEINLPDTTNKAGAALLDKLLKRVIGLR